MQKRTGKSIFFLKIYSVGTPHGIRYLAVKMINVFSQLKVQMHMAAGC